MYTLYVVACMINLVLVHRLQANTPFHGGWQCNQEFACSVNMTEFAAFYAYLCILFCLKHTIWTFAPVYPTVWSDFNLQAPVYPTVHCIPVEYLSIYHLSKGCHNLSVTAYLVIVSIYLCIYIYWSDQGWPRRLKNKNVQKKMYG